MLRDLRGEASVSDCPYPPLIVTHERKPQPRQRRASAELCAIKCWGQERIGFCKEYRRALSPHILSAQFVRENRASVVLAIGRNCP